MSWTNLNDRTFHTINASGKEEKYPLVKGPNGFCIAETGDVINETDIPNLMLDTLAAKRGGPKKKPASNLKAPSKGAKKLEAELEEYNEEEKKDSDVDERSEKEKEDSDVDEREEGDKKAHGPPASPDGKTYLHMYYKKANCYGVRQKFGLKRQIFSFGGTSCKKSKRAMDDIAEQVVMKLNEGLMTETEAKMWAKKQCSRS